MKARNLWIALAALVIVIGGAYALRRPTSTTTTESATAPSTDVSYTCTAGGTALAALEATYPIETKDTSYGKQVMAINQVTASGNQFWAFYISGTSATVGADAYQCQGTEAISWKLESF